MRHPKILIVDDDSDHRALMALSLHRANPQLTIDTAATPAEFTERITASRYDCVVMDYTIPPVTAPEMVQELRTYDADVPVLIVSSSSEQSVVVESIRLGAADYVPKLAAMPSAALWDRVRSAIISARGRLCDRRLTERRMRTLTQAAGTDELTGLANRWTAQKHFDRARRGMGRRSALAVVMCDLDKFKSINDRYGHAGGDAVLKRAASILNSQAAETFCIARWGGEEFLVLLPTADLCSAWNWADCVRRQFGQAPAQSGTDEIWFSGSFGVSIWGPGEGIEDALGRADRALYLAKDFGRNRVCLEAMVRATELGRRIGAEPAGSPRAKLEKLREQLQPSLGQVQRQHIFSHGQEVAKVARRLATTLGHTPADIELLELAAEFHDFGKLAIPESILAAPRRLWPEERRLVDEHARFGADLIRCAKAGDRLAAVVGAHHDRFDHRGDMQSQSPEDRDLAMVLNIADSLTTMLSDRAYCPRLSKARAVIEVRKHAGSQFDPQIVRMLADELYKTAASTHGSTDAIVERAIPA